MPWLWKARYWHSAWQYQPTPCSGTHPAHGATRATQQERAGVQCGSTIRTQVSDAAGIRVCACYSMGGTGSANGARCHARALRCVVLTWRMVLPKAAPQQSASRWRRPVGVRGNVLRIALCMCYAMSGTDGRLYCYQAAHVELRDTTLEEEEVVAP
eukprot:3934138-Rhodomonas_salina.1